MAQELQVHGPDDADGNTGPLRNLTLVEKARVVSTRGSPSSDGHRTGCQLPRRPPASSSARSVLDPTLDLDVTSISTTELQQLCKDHKARFGESAVNSSCDQGERIILPWLLGVVASLLAAYRRGRALYLTCIFVSIPAGSGGQGPALHRAWRLSQQRGTKATTSWCSLTPLCLVPPPFLPPLHGLGPSGGMVGPHHSGSQPRSLTARRSTQQPATSR